MAASLAAAGKLWNCRQCREAKLQEARFCKKEAPFPIFTIDDTDYCNCPVQFVSSESIDALVEYQFYKAGFLAKGGGLDDQPIRFIEAMQAIEAAIDKTVRSMPRR